MKCAANHQWAQVDGEPRTGGRGEFDNCLGTSTYLYGSEQKVVVLKAIARHGRHFLVPLGTRGRGRWPLGVEEVVVMSGAQLIAIETKTKINFSVDQSPA